MHVAVLQGAQLGKCIKQGGDFIASYPDLQILVVHVHVGLGTRLGVSFLELEDNAIVSRLLKFAFLEQESFQ